MLVCQRDLVVIRARAAMIHLISEFANRVHLINAHAFGIVSRSATRTATIGAVRIYAGFVRRFCEFLCKRIACVPWGQPEMLAMKNAERNNEASNT